MVKNTKNPNSQGGYSDIRLWPCYLVVSSLVLFLTPRLGFMVSLVLISTPALYIAKKIGSRIKSPADRANFYTIQPEVTPKTPSPTPKTSKTPQPPMPRLLQLPQTATWIPQKSPLSP